MVKINILDFFKTGNFNCVRLGQTKDQILAHFASPDEVWNNNNGGEIWRYGIVSYHITEKTTEILNFSTENIEKISCIKYFEGKLAILTTQCEGKKDDETSFSVANLYIYDLKTHKNTCIKANFEVKSIFSDAEALCCHSSGKLAVIGLNEIFVLDTQNEYTTTEISAHYPTSVVFSDCGNLIAIGGEKAVLVQLTVSD